MEIGLIVFTVFAFGAVFALGAVGGICIATGVYLSGGRKALPQFSYVEKSKRAETDSERAARLLAENVENYGTDIPQQEII